MCVSFTLTHPSIYPSTQVQLHEICLSIMISNIEHPVVFASLIVSDVLENAYCLWSLFRTSRQQQNTKKIAPMKEEGDVTETKASHQDEQQPEKISLRRTSSIFSLIHDKKATSNKGTALFIAVTLLQRELIECLVPVQAIFILPLMYLVDEKSNSLVSEWDNESLRHAIDYLLIDIIIEFAMFGFTILCLKSIFPEFSSFRIILGLIRMHSIPMLGLSFAAWVTMFMFQNTYSGMDMSLRFEWLSCNGHPNSTWVGGYRWDC